MGIYKSAALYDDKAFAESIVAFHKEFIAVRYHVHSQPEGYQVLPREP